MTNRITHDQKLAWFRSDFQPRFEEWVVAPARRMVEAGDDMGVGMPAFIWLTCSIDWLAGFWHGERTKGKVRQVYIGFIDRYFPTGRYDAENLYESLRNGLVHMYTIQHKKYALTHRHPETHLHPNHEGYILLNLEDFFEDCQFAKNAYFQEVETDKSLLNKAFKRIKRDGFLGLVPVNLLVQEE